MVAVVLMDIAGSLSHSVAEIKGALEGKWGKTCQKDFLRPGSNSPIIQLGKNVRKRRCFVFYLKFLPSTMVEELKKGNCHGMNCALACSNTHYTYNSFYNVVHLWLFTLNTQQLQLKWNLNSSSKNPISHPHLHQHWRAHQHNKKMELHWRVYQHQK